MKRIVGLLTVLIVLALGISVGHFNAQKISFNYLAGTVEISLIWLILGILVISVVGTLLACTGKILGLQAEVRRQKRKLAAAEAELKTLRNLPLGDTNTVKAKLGL